MIIAVQNEKGGVGKTTLSTALAHALVLRGGSRVLLVDADPQGSVLRWSECRQANLPLPFAVLAMPSATLHRDIEAHARFFDAVVIDAPPRSDEIAQACLRAADFVLIPVTPSYYDVWATENTVKMLRNIRVERTEPDNTGPRASGPEAAIILNRVRAGTSIEREVFEALKAFPDVDLLAMRMHERTLHQQVTRSGQTVIELDPTSPAAQEAEALVNEVLELAFAAQEG